MNKELSGMEKPLLDLIQLNKELSGMEKHWKPLLDLIQLVEPLPLRRALREWVNKNQNCAYSIKMGHCDMNCESCLNDVTMSIIYKKDEHDK